MKTRTRNIGKKDLSQKKSVEWNFPLTKKDFIWVLIGVGVVALGYILLATGITEAPATEDGVWKNFWAVDVAPVLLVIGYLVIIPLALMQFFTRRKSNRDKNGNES
ncbi:MAG: DUF3098 domain-containing protein [Ignavibacteria bacterium]|jgi:hypothetical protein|nr:DUF3098 domain-containing protein [Ignavibacteria bacterium]